jgi:hypothetical protein
VIRGSHVLTLTYSPAEVPNSQNPMAIHHSILMVVKGT